MKILKRSGKLELVSFDKILKRIKTLVNDPGLVKLTHVDADILAQKVISQIYDGVSSKELDEYTSKLSISMSVDKHPEYSILASRISISNMHKSTVSSFSDAVELLYAEKIVNKGFYNTVMKYREALDSKIVHSRDYLFDYFGYKTLERSYLFKINGVIIERPQYMWMRVAVALHTNLQKILETYNHLSLLEFTHASPTLFNAGTGRQQLSSCFILSTEDSIEGIFKTITDCAYISKYAGGIGLSISDIRAKDSRIKGTNGKSDGIVPMLRVYNEVSKYINQGSKRPGTFAMYIEPWHFGILEFLELKRNNGDENIKARDLFYAIWMPDLFMKHVEQDLDWYLMCPDTCKNLTNAFGEAFDELYLKYVKEGKYKKKLKAREIWSQIMISQIETGTPYICYKDAVNIKNNQKHLGTIKSSNLCVAPETMILTSTGYHQIKDLENQEVNVWNGEEFTKTTVRKTGEDQELIKVVLSNGSEIECTPYHKFYIYDGLTTQVSAKDLKKDMKIIKTKFPIIREGLKDIITPYENGASFDDEITKFVPINYNIDIKLRWLEGLVDTSPISIRDTDIHINSIHKEFLEKVKYLLQTLGCNPKVQKEKDNYTLIVNMHDISSLYNLGFKPKMSCLRIPDYIREEWVRVEGVVYIHKYSDTYCFTEEKRGKGIFNGIITGQCAEIALYNTSKSTAVCNIATISLPTFVEYRDDNTPFYNFTRLASMAKLLTYNLNRVIDVNYYPTPEAEHNNKCHRPIAVGVQGLYGVFMLMKIPFDSKEALKLNNEIFECIQYHCILESVELSKVDGPYSSYRGSPISMGIFQHNMWNIDEETLKYNWPQLREQVRTHGIRNSMLTALPPTASTSQILGNVESFEVITSNIYIRKVLNGDYLVLNKYLVNDLLKLNLWSSDLKNEMILNDGSIQNIEEIPQYIKNLYKTTWETSQKVTIDLSAGRAPFIDHSQSLNIFIESPSISKLSSMHFYGWNKGLKTGSYYIRSRPISNPEKFSIQKKALSCSIDNKEDCEMCSG